MTSCKGLKSKTPDSHIVFGIPFNIEKSFSFEFAVVGQRAGCKASEIELLDVELITEHRMDHSLLGFTKLVGIVHKSTGNRSISDNLLRTNLES